MNIKCFGKGDICGQYCQAVFHSQKFLLDVFSNKVHDCITLLCRLVCFSQLECMIYNMHVDPSWYLAIE